METARHHFTETCLYTDDRGARILIDGLRLRFAECSTALNALDSCDPGWWALGKVFTYGVQEKPFVHLDHDVFLWKELPDRLRSAPVFAQNPEPFTPGASYYCPERFEEVLQYRGGGWLPEEWIWYRSDGRLQRGECCGIFGGTSVDFIQHYAHLAFRLIDHPANQAGWQLLPDKLGYSVLFEQYLLAACLEYHRERIDSPYRDVRIEYLFDSLPTALRRANAAQVGYTHLIANAKQNVAVTERLQRRVQGDFPEMYERCLRETELIS